MLGGETKLGTRLACLAGLSGRAGASKEVGFPREISAPHPKIEKTLCLAKNCIKCSATACSSFSSFFENALVRRVNQYSKFNLIHHRNFPRCPDSASESAR